MAHDCARAQAPKHAVFGDRESERLVIAAAAAAVVVLAVVAVTSTVAVIAALGVFPLALNRCLT